MIHWYDRKEADLNITVVSMHNGELDNETNRKMKRISEQSYHRSLVQSVDSSRSLLRERMNPTFCENKQ